MSLWQTPSWQKMLQASGQVEEFFELEGIFVEKRQVSMGEFGLFVVGCEKEISEEIYKALQDLCKEQGCLFMQIETLSYEGTLPSFAKGKKGYYKKFIPPYTALIDLELTEEEILANMKPKGRYNIKLARKKGVVVEQVEKHAGNIKIFHSLMSETTSRDNFAGNTYEFYKIFLETLENSQLFFAYHEKEVIAAGIFVASEDTMIYYYGASSSRKRNLMAPYLLQWTAIEHAKKRNLKIYDFLGIAGDDEKDSPLKGVTDFKMKLTKNKHKVSESFLYIHKTWKYQLIQILKKIKK